MFDFLKKTVSGFAEKIMQTIEKKQVQAAKQEPSLLAPKQATIPEQAPIIKGHPKPQEQKSQIDKEPPKAEAEEIKKTRAEESPEKEIPAAKHKEKSGQKTQTAHDDKRELVAKVGLTKKLKGLFTGTITVSKQDIEHFLEEFELALLEADVEAETAREISAKIGKGLEGKQIPSNTDVSGFLKGEIK